MWILIWWIVSPHHAQAIHREVFATEAECQARALIVPAPDGKIVHTHCSKE